MSFHSKKCIRRKKEMCKVIAIANQKGGVGKTTTTVNLGIGLARKGKRVVLIDADPQGSMTVSLGIDEPDKIEYSLANVLMDVVNEEEIDYAKIILKHEENIDFIPANIELAGLEVSMVNVMSRELVMKRFISNIKENYDYILIDCMPSLGMITINALVCANSVLIPVQASYLPVKGLQQLIKTISRVRRQINPELKIEGMVMTMVDMRSNYTKDKVYDSKGKKVYEFTTRKKAEFIEGIFKAGETYTFKEVDAPEHYKIAKDKKIRIKDTGKIQKLTVTDERIPVVPDTPQTGINGRTAGMVVSLISLLLALGCFACVRAKDKSK